MNIECRRDTERTKMGDLHQDRVFRTKQLHPRYRVFNQGMDKPVRWDQQFEDYLSECGENEITVTHRSRRFITQQFLGRESSFVGMSKQDIGTVKSLFSKKEAPKFTRPIHSPRDKRGLLREAYFAVRCSFGDGKVQAFAPALLDSGATKILVSKKMLTDMFGTEVLEQIKPFHGHRVGAGEK